MEPSPRTPTSERVTFDATAGQSSRGSPKKSTPKKESLMQWFDKNVEKELKKRKEPSEAIVQSLVDPTASPKAGKYLSPRLAQSSTSGLDISERLRSAPDTDLTDAVEKLAKAEAACHFAGAVRAAEEAAAAAPPELAEEAAAAGARDFHAEITDTFHDNSGDREKPIQVLGYIGITRPKKPRRP